MSTSERIAFVLEQLGPQEKSEVLDFVEFLKKKKTQRTEKSLKSFSLKGAMRGMEDEPDLYQKADIREPI